MHKHSAFTSQVVPRGTVLKGQDGGSVITDQQAVIPPATPTTPPTYGTVSVSAHSTIPGAAGNIPARNIDQQCCGSSILAQNLYPFSGGRAAQDLTVVTASDITNTTTTLKAALDQETHDQAQAEMKPGQQLLPLSCTTTTIANHHPGDQAQQVSVGVSEQCIALAYTLAALQRQATAIIAWYIPASYRLVRVSLLLFAASVTDATLGTGTLSIHVTAFLSFIPAVHRTYRFAGK